MTRREFIEIVTGAVVLAAAAAFIVYLNFNSGGGGGDGYRLTANFNSVDGVSVGDDVRLVGIRVGSVDSVHVDYDSFRASVRFSIEDGVLIPEDSIAKIRSDGLLGGGYVSILPGGSDEYLAAGDEFALTRGAVDFLEVLSTFAGGGNPDEGDG